MTEEKKKAKPEVQVRGGLTSRVKEKSLEVLGYEISRDELRLMPYIQYLIMNCKGIDPAKINSSERKAFMEWKKRGYCDGGMSGIQISKEFWDAMNEILFLAYVDID